MVIKFKGCPKCQGDLYLNRDSYGRYVSCIQCGFVKDLSEQAVMPVIQKPEPVAIDPKEYQLAA